MNDINVQMVDFPVTTSYEMVRANPDGSYTILINTRQASNQQLEAYSEAIRHIERGDCDTHGNFQDIETEVKR